MYRDIGAFDPVRGPNISKADVEFVRVAGREASKSLPPTEQVWLWGAIRLPEYFTASFDYARDFSVLFPGMAQDSRLQAIYRQIPELARVPFGTGQQLFKGVPNLGSTVVRWSVMNPRLDRYMHGDLAEYQDRFVAQCRIFGRLSSLADGGKLTVPNYYRVDQKTRTMANAVDMSGRVDAKDLRKIAEICSPHADMSAYLRHAEATISQYEAKQRTRLAAEQKEQAAFESAVQKMKATADAWMAKCNSMGITRFDIPEHVLRDAILFRPSRYPLSHYERQREIESGRIQNRVNLNSTTTPVLMTQAAKVICQ